MIEPVFMCHVNSPQGVEVSDLRHEMRKKSFHLELTSYQCDEIHQNSQNTKQQQKKYYINLPFIKRSNNNATKEEDNQCLSAPRFASRKNYCIGVAQKRRH